MLNFDISEDKFDIFEDKIINICNCINISLLYVQTSMLH